MGAAGKLGGVGRCVQCVAWELGVPVGTGAVKRLKRLGQWIDAELSWKLWNWSERVSLWLIKHLSR
jgi:hypothetical protein